MIMLQMQVYADHIKERVAGVLIDLAAKTQEVAHQLWCRVYINMFCTQI